MAGARGRRQIVAEEAMARGSVVWSEGRRQGSVAVRLLGVMVRVIA